jgi:hypothetical protein
MYFNHFFFIIVIIIIAIHTQSLQKGQAYVWFIVFDQLLELLH